MAKQYNFKHGMAGSPTYISWQNMRYRVRHRSCYEGVQICDRWKDNFIAFLRDMGERPSKEMTLDRIDPYGDYSPNNCRWADYKTQGRNKRTTRRFLVNGLMITLPEISEIYHISMNTLKNIYKKDRNTKLETILRNGGIIREQRLEYKKIVKEG